MNEVLEQSWRSAAEAGDTAKAAALGVLLYSYGERAGAHQWWRAAAEGGEPMGMAGYGTLLRDRGVTKEGDVWVTRALATRDPEIAMVLAQFAAERGNEDRVRLFSDQAEQFALHAETAPGQLGIAQARAIAKELLAQVASDSGEPLQLCPVVDTTDAGWAWVFPYATARAIAGDPTAVPPPDGGPIVVIKDTGQTWMMVGSRTYNEQLEAYAVRHRYPYTVPKPVTGAGGL